MAYPSFQSNDKYNLAFKISANLKCKLFYKIERKVLLFSKKHVFHLKNND